MVSGPSKQAPLRRRSTQSCPGDGCTSPGRLGEDGAGPGVRRAEPGRHRRPADRAGRRRNLSETFTIRADGSQLAIDYRSKREFNSAQCRNSWLEQEWINSLCEGTTPGQSSSDEYTPLRIEDRGKNGAGSGGLPPMDGLFRFRACRETAGLTAGDWEFPAPAFPSLQLPRSFLHERTRQ